MLAKITSAHVQSQVDLSPGVSPSPVRVTEWSWGRLTYTFSSLHCHSGGIRQVEKCYVKPRLCNGDLDFRTRRWHAAHLCCEGKAEKLSYSLWQLEFEPRMVLPVVWWNWQRLTTVRSCPLRSWSPSCLPILLTIWGHRGLGYWGLSFQSAHHTSSFRDCI